MVLNVQYKKTFIIVHWLGLQCYRPTWKGDFKVSINWFDFSDDSVLKMY